MAKRPRLVACLTAALLGTTLLPALSGTSAAEPPPDPPAASSGPAAADHSDVALVRVEIPDNAAIDKLVAAGYDLAEYRKPLANGAIEVNVVTTTGERQALAAMGYSVTGVISGQADVTQLTTERTATLQATEAAEAAGPDTLTPLRAEWFTSTTGQAFLSVEVKTDQTASSNKLTVTWESGSAQMERFTDAGVYMYDRFDVPIPISAAPTSVTVTSTLGATVTIPVTEWLGQPRPEPRPTYASDFVDHYMDPTEVYARIQSLATEFPGLTELIDLPNKTNGYRRQAQAQFGETRGAAADSAVYFTSKAYGSEGGNDISVELRAGSANQSLSVSVTGTSVVVNLGTDATGSPVSTAADVVAAVTGSTAASALLSASTYRGNAGTGLVAAAPATTLTDGLDAPASVSRDPFQMQALRIGKTRDGSKTGVFLYCQEHAREWVTPLVCVETAERLLRNYSTDPTTKKLVDNLDIFIVPSINPDGGHFSFYDYNFQRKNMTNYCPDTSGDPGRQNSWGVDINRNFSVGSAFDGYVGASTTNCTSGTFAGPGELSEPEARNEVWLADTYPNIKFAMNTHSYGGYFMWPPGAYKIGTREPLPRTDAGTDEFFWAASGHILSAVQSYRGTAIWPGYTGPVIDVLYSAAGNSADELWYDKGIIGWDFEVGADIWNPETNEWEGVGFQPPFSEGHEEAMEFSAGQIGILEVALASEKDHQRPGSTLSITSRAAGSTSFTFATSEPATVYYTVDGSRPTFESPKLAIGGIREGAEAVTVSKNTTVKWFSVDIAGNVEKNYQPLGSGTNYNSQRVTVR